MENEKRLIDAIEYCWELVAERDYPGRSQEFMDAIEVAIADLGDMPTVDAVEVVHGWWIEKIDMVASYLAGCEEIFYECSVCNSPNFGESPYCPNCGAKMDGERKDND